VQHGLREVNSLTSTNRPAGLTRLSNEGLCFGMASGPYRHPRSRASRALDHGIGVQAEPHHAARPPKIQPRGVQAEPHHAARPSKGLGTTLYA